MLILILIDVHYPQNTVFSFAKGSNCQKHSSSESHQLAENPPSKVFDSPQTRGGIYSPPFTAIWKTLKRG